MAGAMTERTFSRARLAAMFAAEAFARWSPARLAGLGMPFGAPEKLLAAPRPLLPGSATAAAALYGGAFTLAGTRVEADSGSIFDVAAPNEDWARALHGFSWLADLSAANTALSRAYSRTLIEQWVETGRHHPVAQQPDVTAGRLMNWLAYAGTLLDDAEPQFRRKFLRGLMRQAVRLKHDIRRMPFGMGRVRAAIALTEAGLCLPDSARLLAAGSSKLAADLRAMILPDGGIATRNPADILALAADILPLRLCFIERGLEAPRELHTALDRMMPALRFFRHGDGSLALFNGMGPTPAALLEAVLARDDAQGLPVLDARFAGYQRLEGGTAIVITDAGRPPPLALSGEAHAGTLAFELSAGACRIVVNCGAPQDGHAARRMAARKTAAHSTVSIGESSSARFLTGKVMSSMLGPLMKDGPRRVNVVRENRTSATTVGASHDGYAGRFGLVHERTLVLDALGTRLSGTDTLRPVRNKTGADVVVAFHLHPDVRATPVGDEGQAILLTLPDGERWLFAAEDHPARIEESIFFAGPDGARRAEQIVVRLGRKAGARLAWSFSRAGYETVALPPPLS